MKSLDSNFVVICLFIELAIAAQLIVSDNNYLIISKFIKLQCLTVSLSSNAHLL